MKIRFSQEGLPVDVTAFCNVSSVASSNLIHAFDSINLTVWSVDAAVSSALSAVDNVAFQLYSRSTFLRASPRSAHSMPTPSLRVFSLSQALWLQCRIVLHLQSRQCARAGPQINQCRCFIFRLLLLRSRWCAAYGLPQLLP